MQLRKTNTKIGTSQVEKFVLKKAKAPAKEVLLSVEKLPRLVRALNAACASAFRYPTGLVASIPAPLAVETTYPAVGPYIQVKVGDKCHAVKPLGWALVLTGDASNGLGMLVDPSGTDQAALKVRFPGLACDFVRWAGGNLGCKTPARVVEALEVP